MCHPEFRLFAHPHRFSTYQEEPATCDLCHLFAAVYLGPFHGEDDLESICENCLKTGGLADSGAWCNDGDFAELRDQIVLHQPHLKPRELDKIVEKLLSELMERTPPLATWTEFPWPLLDGDWCRFIQEVGLGDLQAEAAAAGRPLEEWFGQHVDLTRSVKGDPESLLRLIRPGQLTDNRSYHPTGAYLFRSLSTGRPLIVVDQE
jgi:uncharacterized protein CbrC (UPF0167 family)